VASQGDEDAQWRRGKDVQRSSDLGSEGKYDCVNDAAEYFETASKETGQSGSLDSLPVVWCLEHGLNEVRSI